MRWIGHHLEAEAELTVDPSISLEHAHRLAHAAETRLTQAVPKFDRALVHAYPHLDRGQTASLET